MKGDYKMTTTTIAIAAAIAIGLSTIAPAIAQGLAASKALEGMARQPEVAGEIRTTMILALAFMEALTIYGLLVAILLVNKL